MDSYFRLLYWASVFRRVDFYLLFQKMFFQSSGFPRSKQLNDFLLETRYFSRHIMTHRHWHKEFLFTLIIYSSIINQNTIDFCSKREKEKQKLTRGYFSWLVSDTKKTSIWDIKTLWLFKLMARYSVIFSAQSLFPGCLPPQTFESTLTVQYCLISHSGDLILQLKKKSIT